MVRALPSWASMATSIRGIPLGPALALLRVTVAAEELPPRDAFVLAEPPLLGRRQELQDLEAEEAGIGGVEVELLKQNLHRLDDVVRPEEAAPVEARPRVAVDQRDRGLGTRAQPAVDVAARPISDRRARHRVDHVPVEARVEAEAVLARQVAAAGRAGAGHRLRARLATPGATRLVDVNLEPALGEFVRCGQPADSAADDDHPGHALRPPTKLLGPSIDSPGPVVR